MSADVFTKIRSITARGLGTLEHLLFFGKMGVEVVRVLCRPVKSAHVEVANGACVMRAPLLTKSGVPRKSFEVHNVFVKLRPQKDVYLSTASMTVSLRFWQSEVVDVLSAARHSGKV